MFGITLHLLFLYITQPSRAVEGGGVRADVYP